MFQSFDDVTDPSHGKTRIKLLRGEMSSRGLDAFLVPHADEYMNEYVPPAGQRLHWLTGFSGSAGFAIVFKSDACIFVDGRYTLQVTGQVDTETFKIYHLIDEPPHTYLSRTAASGQRIGFDPRLHTVEEAARLRAACAQAGAELVACDNNPIDAVWQDRPADPLGQVKLHPVAYAGIGADDKIKRVRHALEDEGSDALIVTQPENVAWLLNIRGADVAHTPLPLSNLILDRKNGASLFIDERKLNSSVREGLRGIVTLREPAQLHRALHDLRERNITVRIDPAKCSDWFLTRLDGGNARIQKGSDPIDLMKAQKNEVEIKGSRAAHLRDGIAMARFLAWFDEHAASGGLSEIDAAEMLESLRAESGELQEISFDTIAAAGPHAALPHYRVSRSSNRKIRDNSIFLIDSGAQYRDGTTDITRTIIVGRPTDEMRDRFTRVLKGHIAIAMARFPLGTSGAQIDSFARRPLWDAGLDFDHGTGHGIGSYLSVHEGPVRISKISSVPIKPGMILSNEPGYYKPGSYGIRIENLVLVRAPVEVPGGERPLLSFETLTFSPIDQRLIAPGLMSAQEIQWLDAYHASVRDKIGPHLDIDTQAWLANATKPLM